MQINWITSVAAGALEAARSVLYEQRPAGRRLVDRSLAAAIAPPARALVDAIAAAGVAPDECWPHLVPLAALEASTDLAAGSMHLAAEALSQAGASPPAQAQDRVGRALADVAGAFIAASPRMGEELALRQRPIHEQWEARGPGLLAAVRRRAGADWLLGEATIALVPPILGGAGQPYPAYQLVTLEAVLFNPIPQLPEVLRIAWILASLTGKRATGAPAESHAQRAARAALAAVVLAAAEEVELARADRGHFDLMATQWLGDGPIAEPLWHWWQDYATRRPAWLAGLKMLEAALG